jgi:hypothetical protein
MSIVIGISEAAPFEIAFSFSISLKPRVKRQVKAGYTCLVEPQQGRFAELINPFRARTVTYRIRGSSFDRSGLTTHNVV